MSLAVFENDAPLVRQAIATVTSVLGPPDQGFTKKVVRWDRPEISVNVFRESRNRACLCVAGKHVRVSGEVVWPNIDQPALRDPLKNSNCSRAIKVGPTLWLYTADSFQFEAA